LTETRAILKTVAREKTPQLVPKDPVLLRKAEMIESVLWDVWFALIRRLIADTVLYFLHHGGFMLSNLRLILDLDIYNSPT